MFAQEPPCPLKDEKKNSTSSATAFSLTLNVLICAGGCHSIPFFFRQYFYLFSQNMFLFSQILKTLMLYNTKFSVAAALTMWMHQKNVDFYFTNLKNDIDSKFKKYYFYGILLVNIFYAYVLLFMHSFLSPKAERKALPQKSIGFWKCLFCASVFDKLDQSNSKAAMLSISFYSPTSQVPQPTCSSKSKWFYHFWHTLQHFQWDLKA